MKYIKYLSFLSVIVSIAAIGVKLYSGSKSAATPGLMYDKIKTMSAQQDSGLWTDSKAKEILETFKVEAEKLEEKDNTASITLWAKIIFSGVFCIAALFVVLSNKYNDDTKKWAFSVLTLVAGVWIGSVTK